MLSGGAPFRSFGALRSGGGAVGIIYDKTDAAVTLVKGQTGFAVAHTSSTVTALTFPKNFKFLSGFASRSGNTNNEGQITDVDLTNGTANVRWSGAPGTCRVYLTLFVGE